MKARSVARAALLMMVSVSTALSCSVDESEQVALEELRQAYLDNQSIFKILSEACRDYPGLARLTKTHGPDPGDAIESAAEKEALVNEISRISASVLSCNRLYSDSQEAVLHSAQIYLVARGLAVSGRAAGLVRIFGSGRLSPRLRGDLEAINPECRSDCWYVFDIS